MKSSDGNSHACSWGLGELIFEIRVIIAERSGKRVSQLVN